MRVRHKPCVPRDRPADGREPPSLPPMKGTTMVTIMLARLRSWRQPQNLSSLLTQQLRHAGYQDGERLPRTLSHWTNSRR